MTKCCRYVLADISDGKPYTFYVKDMPCPHGIEFITTSDLEKATLMTLGDASEKKKQGIQPDDYAIWSVRTGIVLGDACFPQPDQP